MKVSSVWLKVEFAFLLIFVALVPSIFTQNEWYCNEEFCTKSDGTVEPHIACPGNAVTECPSDAHEMDMSGCLRDIILDKHNEYRNTLAGGDLAGFPEASRMPVMVWDNELSAVAGVNAKRCIYGFDTCRNVDRFRYVGQNVGYSEGFTTNEDHINSVIDGWWDQYKDATVGDIENYGSSANMIANFTLMAQDRANRIGCAGVTYATNKRILVCNYCFTNYYDSYVYKTGPTASDCTTGTDTKYTNMCSLAESIWPVPFPE